MSDFIDQSQRDGKLFFDLREVSRVIKAPKAQLISSISYFKKKGVVVSLLKGFYVILPLKERKRGSLEPQDMVVLAMQQLGIPYYAALLSAGRYHGATHQVAQVFQVITNKRIKKPWVIGRVSIEFIYKKSLALSKVEERIISTGALKVSTAEQTVKDIMLYPDKSGGLNHQATILAELVDAIKPNKLIKMASQDRKRAWLQRLAYIVEQIEITSKSKKEALLDKLYFFLKDKRCNYIPLASELSTVGCPRDEKWKVIKNTTIESDI